MKQVSNLSDLHHMIYTILKTTFMNTKPKVLKYRCYKDFSLGICKDSLTENLMNDCNSCDDLITYFRVSWINVFQERTSKFEVTVSLI